MTVRDPVVTMVSLPRFLAPGDNARHRRHHQQSRRPGRRLRAEDDARPAPGASRRRSSARCRLDAGANFTDGFTLAATTVGNVAMHLDLTGPSDLRDRARLHDRRAPGAVVSAAALCRAAAAGPERDARRRRRRRVPARHRRGAAVGQPAPRLGRARRCCGRSTAIPMAASSRRRAARCRCSMSSEVASLWQSRSRLLRRPRQIDGAIGHIAELQRSDGSFGVWSDSDDTVPWLDAYATDFLMRAKEHGNTVPDFALNGGARLAARLCAAGAQATTRICRRSPTRITCWRGPRPAICRALRYFNDTADGRGCRPSSPRRSSPRRSPPMATRRAPRAAYRRRAGAAADARPGLRYHRLRQRTARQRRGAGLRRRRPGDAAAADRGRSTASPSCSPTPTAPAPRSRPGC